MALGMILSIIFELTVLNQHKAELLEMADSEQSAGRSEDGTAEIPAAARAL
jgi:hypothetical protein